MVPLLPRDLVELVAISALTFRSAFERIEELFKRYSRVSGYRFCYILNTGSFRGRVGLHSWEYLECTYRCGYFLRAGLPENATQKCCRRYLKS